MNQACANDRAHQPWWKRRPAWYVGGAVALALLIGVAIEQAGSPAPAPYSAFIDQLEAGNVTSITLQGTVINARLKHPLVGDSSNGSATQGTLTSRVPDFGNPSLMPELRKQRVVINVSVPSAWAWLLGRIPWPMLAFIGAMLVAGIVRLIRGGKAVPGAMPMHGALGLVSGLFVRQHHAASPPTENGDAANRC